MTSLNETSPKWLKLLERHFGWIEIPHISILLVTLQVFGFFFVTSDPAWFHNLALIPSAVAEGQYWRLVTFLALPLSMSPIWMFFVLWFLYFIVNSLETAWGAFKTTLYILVSVLVTIIFSLTTGYPVTQVSHFESTLFLAAASLFPEMQVQLFMLVPVKMKWLAWLTGFFVIAEAISGGWMDRFYLMAIYSNFLLFFGPAVLGRIKQAYRKWKFKR